MSLSFFKHKPAIDFPDVYRGLLLQLLNSNVIEKNERTGKIIKIYPYGPMSFSLDLSSGFLPVPGNRKMFPGTAAAEIAWYISGLQDATLMMQHAKVVWEKFLEPWPNRGEGPFVRNAYGYRWRRHFDRDQLRLAIDSLKINPSDRRIWISAWDPKEDGLGMTNQINVPCPVGFTLSILDGKLQSSYVLRSSDVFVGLPYDVMGHAMLMALIAVELNVDLGYMHFTLAHPHIYNVHWHMADKSLTTKKVKTKINLLKGVPWTIDFVQKNPETFITAYKQAGSLVNWAKYHCKPEVVQ